MCRGRQLPGHLLTQHGAASALTRHPSAAPAVILSPDQVAAQTHLSQLLGLREATRRKATAEGRTPREHLIRALPYRHYARLSHCQTEETQAQSPASLPSWHWEARDTHILMTWISAMPKNIIIHYRFFPLLLGRDCFDHLPFAGAKACLMAFIKKTPLFVRRVNAA